MRIRPYRPGDRDAAAGVCLRTADAGRDASGLCEDDDLWSLVFVLPYLERHPDLAWVVEADEGRVVGYVVATDDTDAFAQWFRDEWWPPLSARFPRPDTVRTRQDGIVRDASERRPGAEPYPAMGFPAHLHIDLLPEAQGRGIGRRLIGTVLEKLRARGVPGLHLVADARNVGAAAFYERLGFARLESREGGRAFGLRLG